MSSPISSQPSPPQATSRGSGFSRKIASKVLILIEKFESLTRVRPPDKTPPFPQSPYTSARTSTFRRLGTSVLKRASEFAEQRANPPPEKRQAPKRRFLRISRHRTKNRVASKQKVESEHIKSRNSSNGFDCDGTGSTIDSDSTLIDTDISSTSTPPVARILPSSFFDQLLPSGEHTPTRRRFGYHKRQERKKKVKSSENPIRDLEGVIGPKESTSANTKRKPVPLNLPVRGLTERWREVEREKVFRELNLKKVEEPPKGLMQKELNSREDQGSLTGFPREQLNLREADNSFGVLSNGNDTAKPAEMDYNNDGLYSDSFYDTSMGRDSMSTCTTESAPVVCRDRRYLSTNYMYMPDGTFSNLGYLMHCLGSEAGTPSPDFGAETTDASASSTITTRSGSLESKTGKVYRKTPPPFGFFDLENRRIPSTSDIGERLEEASPIEAFFDGPEIISPIPLNAVQAAELRGMVFRYT